MEGKLPNPNSVEMNPRNRNTSGTTKPRCSIIAAAGLLLGLGITATQAQVTPGGTLGDTAILTQTGGGEALTTTAFNHDFDTITEDPTYEHNPGGGDATQVALSAGRHLVLYDTRFDTSGGGNRSEIQNVLNLAGTTLPVGRSQGYIRRASGADECIISGGAIITVANDDDILQLQSFRTDNNAAGVIREPNGTALQLVKLDDAWDFLSLSRGANQAGVNNATFIDVAYDTVDTDSSPGTAFSFTATSGDITLNETGAYLVFANTSIQKAANTTRTGYTQRLTLDGTEVAGSRTTTYVRGNESCDEGMAAIGMLVEATAGDVLNVEVNKPSGTNGVIQGGETGITIVKLPSTTNYISLSDTTNQMVNGAAVDPVTFATQTATGSSFSHTAGTSAVTVNDSTDFLFLSQQITDTDDGTNDNQERAVIQHGWQIDGAGGFAGRGNGGQYNRDLVNFKEAGSWGAGILPLVSGQTVELITQQLGTGENDVPASSVTLQGISIQSLIPSNDPIVVTNEQLSVVINTTGTITTAHLEVVDADDTPADLTYTVTSAPTLGTLKNGVATVPSGGTFTQADIDAGDITFEAAGVTGSGGFDFSVEDDSGSGNAATGSFVIGVGEATVVDDDSGTTNEDTVLTTVDAGANVLVNDSGTGLAVTAFDASSAMGAAVTVDAAGVINYDPTAAPAIQALDDGDVAADSFTYTVTDFSFTDTVGNVNITLNGVNDAPVVVDDSASGTDQAGPTINVLANDSDVDANDTLTLVSINGTPVPLAGITLLSPEDATLTVTPDGTLIYDPGTSADITSLNNGATLEDIIGYEVSDGTVTIQGQITITSVGTLGAGNDVGFANANSTASIDILLNDDLLGAPGAPTAGALADFNAADVGNTDMSWINNGTGTGVNMTMENPGVQSVLNTSLVGAPPGVTAAYDLTGTGSGSPLEDADNTNSIYGANVSTTDLTLEMVFRPDELSGNEPLWGTGGNGTGSSLVLLDDQLIFTAGQGSTVLQVVGTVASTQYVHVIVTVDLATDTAELFINNALVDTSTAINITNGAAADITDWSGTDNEGLGRSNGTTGGDVNVAPFLGSFGTVDIPDFNEANDRFEGEIAILRIYSGPVLDAAARTANYAAIVGTPSDPVVGDIVDLAGETTLVPGTTVVSLPSGATVKLESNGTLTYDPNGAFDHIATGLEGTDSFTYTLGGGEPATATVVVRIFGSNTDPQVTIAADQSDVTEGNPAGFTLSAASNVAADVTANLSYSGTASDGTDYTGQATALIGNGTNTADLDLTTIADSLFENGVETIIVTIDSVTGPGTVGANPGAATNLVDGDAPPVFTITGGGAVTEGSSVGFTVSASVASSEPIDIDLSYPGSATAADFNPVPQISVPAMATSLPLVLMAFDDGIADSGETIEPTLSNPTLGSIGSPGSATATISDGAGTLVFFADFEGVDPLDTPGDTLLNADAPDAANLGTAIGYWANVLTVSNTGAAPGLIMEQNDVRGDGNDMMLRQDRPNSGPEGELCASFDGALDISGSNTGTISFDIAQLRTLDPAKDTRILGLDPAGNKTFELVISGDNAAPGGRSLYHVDAIGTETQISPFNTFPNTQDFGNGGNNESAHTNLRLSLAASGYVVTLDHPLGGQIDGVPDLITSELAYAGSATLISKVVFQIAGSLNANTNGGIFLDNVSAAGISLTTQEAWRQVYYGSPANSGPGEDSATAANGLTNLQSFALGLDPTGTAGILDVDTVAGTILSAGPPTIWVDPNTGLFYLRYTRREDLSILGLDATDEFSRNPNLPFELSAVDATVIASGYSGGVPIIALQNEFPSSLPLSEGIARYGRVNVKETP